MASELAVGYITLLPSARGIASGLEKELTGPLVLASKTSGEKASTAWKSQFKKGLTSLAVGGAVIGGLAAVGKSFEDAFNSIARGTGATGKTLQGLDQSFRTVLKSGSGSFEQVSAAITTLYQRTGLTGKALEDFAKKEVSLARITKTDVNENLQVTTGLFNLFGVAAKDQSANLDVLFKASQVAGVSVSQLADEMKTAAPTAKILGLNLGQTASFVANLDKAGLPAAKVMAGLAGAFSKAAKAGKDPLAVIKDLTAQVKAAPSPTAAATIAIQKFGIGARQASVLVAGLRSGTLDLTKSLDGGKGILATAAATTTLSGKLGHLKNIAVVALEPLATQALGAITKGIELLTPAIEFLTDHMNVLGPIIVTVAGAFAAFKVVVGIQDVILASVDAFSALTDVLFVQTGAAAAEATAMTGVTVATTEATVASKGFALTPIGATALAAAAAVAFLVIKLKVFSGAQKDAGSATNSLISSLLDEGKSLEQVAGQVVVKAIRNNKSLGETFTAIKIPLSTVNSALLGNAKSVKAVAAAGIEGVKTGKISLEQYAKLTGFLSKNSKSLDDQKSAKDRSTAASKELAAAETATVNPAKAAALAQDQLRIAATNLTTAIINNADRLRGLQEGLIGVFQSAINLKQGLTDIAEKQAAYDVFVKAGTQNTKDGVKALQDLQLARLGQISSTDAAVDSTAKFADSTSHLSDALKIQKDAQDALGKATADFNSGKGSPEAVAAAQATLSKRTREVAVAQDKFREAIRTVAARISGPLHDALLLYAGQIANLPPTKPTVVTTPGLSAATLLTHNFRGELDGLKPKKVKIELDADAALHSLGLLDVAVRKINPNISLVAVNRAQGGRASGGDVKAGSVHLVGEKGPEFVQFKQDAHVFAHGQIPFGVDKNFGADLRSGPIDARVVVNGNVNGVDDLDAWADQRDRKLALALRAG